MQIKIENVPFARFGSYLTFSVLPPSWGYEGLVWRTMHRGAQHEVFRMAMIRNGHTVPYRVKATPTLCSLEPTEGEGKIELCLPETDVVRLRGSGGVGLRLESVPLGQGHYAFPLGDDAVNINCPANKVQYRMFPLHGDLQMDMPVHIGDHKRGVGEKRNPSNEPAIVVDFQPAEDGRFEFCAQEYIATPQDVVSLERNFDECHEMARKHWFGWMETAPDVPERYREGAAHAMHVN